MVSSADSESFRIDSIRFIETKFRDQLNGFFLVFWRRKQLCFPGPLSNFFSPSTQVVILFILMVIFYENIISPSVCRLFQFFTCNLNSWVMEIIPKSIQNPQNKVGRAQLVAFCGLAAIAKTESFNLFFFSEKNLKRLSHFSYPVLFLSICYNFLRDKPQNDPNLYSHTNETPVFHLLYVVVVISFFVVLLMTERDNWAVFDI